MKKEALKGGMKQQATLLCKAKKIPKPLF